MADKKEDDQFALTVTSGAPAYPKSVDVPDGDKKYPNGAPIMKHLGVAKNPDEHKKLLADHKGGDKWPK